MAQVYVISAKAFFSSPYVDETYDYVTTEELIEILNNLENYDGRHFVVEESCPLPPPDWWCSGKPGHEGPCAAWPLRSELWPDALK